MKPKKVIKILPDSKFIIQVDIVGVCQQLVEFLLIRSMGSFNLAIHLGSSRFNVYATNSPVFHMPIKLGLPLMSEVRACGMNATWKPFHSLVHKVNSASLIVLLLDVQDPDPSGITDSRVLMRDNSGVCWKNQLDFISRKLENVHLFAFISRIP